MLRGAVRVPFVESGLAAASSARNSDVLLVKTEGAACAVGEGLREAEAEFNTRAEADAAGTAFAECWGADIM